MINAMNDNTLTWVIPALSLGYTVAQDDDGRLRFWHESVDIIFRDGEWLAFDGDDQIRTYDSIQTALKNEV